MIINTVTAVVNPDMPKTNLSQPLFVYVPVATTESKGIASFKDTDFIVDANGQVMLGLLYSQLPSDLNDPETGLKRRVSNAENSIINNTQQINSLSNSVTRLVDTVNKLAVSSGIVYFDTYNDYIENAELIPNDIIVIIREISVEDTDELPILGTGKLGYLILA